MSVLLHRAGEDHARKLIKRGQFNDTAPWSFDADDGNRLLGTDPDNLDWDKYAKWHLDSDSEKDTDSRAAWKYPYGKNDNVYRSALRAIQTRAAQEGLNTIFDVAGRLMDLMDEQSESKANQPMIERRNLDNVEIRIVKGDDDSKHITGHAAVFNKDSVGLCFIERILPGTFKDSIEKDDVVALFNHDSNIVLGRKSAKTLTVEEDKEGLLFDATLPETYAAKDLHILVDRGDVNGASFGFITLDDKWETENEGETLVRILSKVQLIDVSPATFPAFPDTKIATRSMDRWLKQELAANSPWRREIARRRLVLAELK